MRLFVGIKTGCDDYLVSLQQRLKEYGRGNFTKRDNLHITLKFLGEVESGKQKDICEAISDIKCKPFYLECRGIGVFNSRIAFVKVGGDIHRLSYIFLQLENALFKKGFKKETREYKPHITLARGFRPRLEIESIECKCQVFLVNEITLFESRREDGSLKYIPLFVHKINAIKD